MGRLPSSIWLTTDWASDCAGNWAELSGICCGTLCATGIPILVGSKGGWLTLPFCTAGACAMLWGCPKPIEAEGMPGGTAEAA